MSNRIVTQLGPDGDFARGFSQVLSTSAATAQKVRSRLLLVQGEWFLDPDAGVPWFANDASVDPPIMGSRGIDLGYVERTIKRTILETEGVSKLVDFSMALDRETRRCSIFTTLETDDGDVESIEVSVP
jgi:hypothetical protein